METYNFLLLIMMGIAFFFQLVVELSRKKEEVSEQEKKTFLDRFDECQPSLFKIFFVPLIMSVLRWIILIPFGSRRFIEESQMFEYPDYQHFIVLSIIWIIYMLFWVSKYLKYKNNRSDKIAYIIMFILPFFLMLVIS